MNHTAEKIDQIFHHNIRHKKWKRVFSVLMAVVVFVTTYVLILPALTAEATTYCGMVEHQHDASCQAGNQPCAKEEHVHTLACYSNPEADLETAEDWEKTLPQRADEPDGKADAGILPDADALVAVAESQIGYAESKENYAVAEDKKTMSGYSRYGAWRGEEYEPWALAFAAFCLHYAANDPDAVRSLLPADDTDADAWMEALKKAGYEKVIGAESLEASQGSAADELTVADYAAGDLVFLQPEKDGCLVLPHVGIVTQTGKNSITLVEGDRDDKVRKTSYRKNSDAITAVFSVCKNQDGAGRDADGRDAAGKDTGSSTDQAAAGGTSPAGQTGDGVEAAGDSATGNDGADEASGDGNGTGDGSDAASGAGSSGADSLANGSDGADHLQDAQADNDPANGDGMASSENGAAGNGDITSAGKPERLIYEGRGYRVTASYGADAGLPEYASLEVKEIRFDKKYRKLAEEALQETGSSMTLARFFDISFMAGKKEIEPQGKVDISFSWDESQTLDDGAQVKAIHLPEDQEAEIIDASIESTTDAVSKQPGQTVTFTADSFSVYGIVYTVDFSYSVNGKMYDFSLPGGEKIALSELIEVLGILQETKFEDVEEFLAEVEKVEFSDPELVKVSKSGLFGLGNDWVLESLRPFDTQETLRIEMTNGDVVTVRVTDAQAADASAGLTSINIEGATRKVDENGKEVYEIKNGETYKIDLNFTEKAGGFQFPMDGSGFYYQLPEGINAAGAKGDIASDDGSYKIHYEVGSDGRTVNFSWVVLDEDKFEDVKNSNSVKVNLKIDAVFDTTKTELKFSDTITKNIEGNYDKDVSVSKSANYDYGNHIMWYTITVHADGSAEYVVVNDSFKNGNVFTSDQNVTLSGETTPATNVNYNGNAFTINIGHMNNNETRTYTYSAHINESLLNQIENGTIKPEQTGNTVRVTSDKDDNPNNSTADSSFQNEIKISSLSKGVVSTTEVDENGKSTLTWKITANDEQLVHLNQISDTIAADSRAYMSYSGAGLTITVVMEDGTTVERNVNWGEDSANGKLVKTDSSWTYTPPTSDRKAKYTITYTTEGDGSNIITPTTVNNSAGTDYNGTTGSGTVDPKPDNNVDLQKHAVSSSLSDKVVNWEITFQVPKSGLKNVVVTDTFPTTNAKVDGEFKKVYDLLKEGSVVIEGLNDDEKNYTWEYVTTEQWDGNVKNVINSGIKFNFGNLAGGDKARTITIKLTTTLNDDWLEAAERSAALANISSELDSTLHTNRVNLKVDGGEANAEDSVDYNFKEPSMEKKYLGEESNVWVNGTNVKAYRYEVYLRNITESAFDAQTGYLTVQDTYEGKYLNHLSFGLVDNSVKCAEEGVTYYNAGNPGDIIIADKGNNNWVDQALVNVDADDDNGVITFNVDKYTIPRKEDNSLYSDYKLVYVLYVKDKATEDAMLEEAYTRTGGSIPLKNTVEFGDLKDEVTVDYQAPVVTKDILNADAVKNGNTDTAQYKIVINPEGKKIGTENFLTVTDEYSNQSVDYAQVTFNPADAVLEMSHSGNSMSMIIKNETPLTITYPARVLTSGTYSNTVTVNGQEVTASGEAKINSSGGTSHGNVTFNVMKYASGNMLDRLEGAEFDLYEQYVTVNGNDVTVDREEKAATLKTDASGMIEIEKINHIDGTQNSNLYSEHEYENKTVRYKLVETKAPEGYEKVGFDYLFTIADADANLDNTELYAAPMWRYLNGDVLTIDESPKEEDGTWVKVTKTWADVSAADMPDSITIRVLKKSDRFADNSTGTEVASHTLTKADNMIADGTWCYTFTGLDALKAGESYVIAEDPIPGFDITYEGKNELGLTASGSLSLKNQRQRLVIKKEWDGGAPDSTVLRGLNVNVKKDGEVVKTVSLTAANNWTTTLDNLEYPGVYTVEEDSVAGYMLTGINYEDSTVTESGTTVSVKTATITNKKENTPSGTSFNVEKKWYNEDVTTELTGDAIKDLTAKVQLVRYRAEKSGTTVHFIDESLTERCVLELKNNITDVQITFNNKGLWDPAQYYVLNTMPSDFWGIYNNVDKVSAIETGNGTNEDPQILTITTGDNSDLYVLGTSWSYLVNPKTNDDNLVEASSTFETDPDYEGKSLTLGYNNYWKGTFSGLQSYGTGKDGKRYNYTYAIKEIDVPEGFALDSYSNGANTDDSTVSNVVTDGSIVTVKNVQSNTDKTSIKINKQWSSNDHGGNTEIKYSVYSTTTPPETVKVYLDYPVEVDDNNAGDGLNNGSELMEKPYFEVLKGADLELFVDHAWWDPYLSNLYEVYYVDGHPDNKATGEKTYVTSHTSRDVTISAGTYNLLYKENIFKIENVQKDITIVLDYEKLNAEEFLEPVLEELLHDSLTPVTSGSITSAGNWTTTISNLPKTDEEGHPLYYFVYEDDLDIDDTKDLTHNLTRFDVRYSHQYINASDSSAHEVTITNTIRPQYTWIQIKKQWENITSEEQPDSISVVLYRRPKNSTDKPTWYDKITITKTGLAEIIDGTKYDTSLVGNWVGGWYALNADYEYYIAETNVDGTWYSESPYFISYKDASGKEIKPLEFGNDRFYRVETGAPANTTGWDGNSATIVNEKTDIHFEKKWAGATEGKYIIDGEEHALSDFVIEVQLKQYINGEENTGTMKGNDPSGASAIKTLDGAVDSHTNDTKYYEDEEWHYVWKGLRAVGQDDRGNREDYTYKVVETGVYLKDADGKKTGDNLLETGIFTQKTSADGKTITNTFKKSEEGDYQIQITKYIVDEEGNQIGLAASTSTAFKIYHSSTAKSDDVKDLNVGKYDTPYNDMLSSYTEELGSLTVPVATSGYGYDYYYKVPAGMYTIEEDRDSIPKTVIDSDGNKWEYVSTHLETEYAWRKEGDTNKRHFSNQYTNDTDSLIAVPEVAGQYGKDEDGKDLENKVLDFFAINVYKKSQETKSDTMNLNIIKDWKDGEDTTAPTSGSVVFRLHQVRNITTKDGTGKDTVTTELDALNSGYPMSVTVTADDGWTTKVEKLPLKIEVDENTTVTYSYYLEEVSRVGAASAYRDVTFKDNLGGDRNHAVAAEEDEGTATIEVTNSKSTTPPDEKVITIKKTWLDQYGDEPQNHDDYVLVDIYRIKLPEGSGGNGGTFNSIGGLNDVIGDPRSWKDNNNEIQTDVIFYYNGYYYYVRQGQSEFSRWQLQEWDDQLDAGYMSGDHVTRLTGHIYTDEQVNEMAARNEMIQYGDIAIWNGEYYVYRYTGGSFDGKAQQYGPSKSGNWSKIGRGNILDGVRITPPDNTRFVEEEEITGEGETIIGSDTTEIGKDSYIEKLYEMIDKQLEGTGVTWSAEDKQLQLYLKDVKITKADGWTATLSAESGYLYFFFEHEIKGYTTTYGYEEYGVYDQQQNVEIVNQTTVDQKTVDLTVKKQWQKDGVNNTWPTGYTVTYKVVQKAYIAGLTSTLNGSTFEYTYNVDKDQHLFDKELTSFTVDAGTAGELSATTTQQKISALPVGVAWSGSDDADSIAEKKAILEDGMNDEEKAAFKAKLESGKSYAIGFVYEIVETEVRDASGNLVDFGGVTEEFNAVENRNAANASVALTNNTTELKVKKTWTKNGVATDWLAGAQVYFTVDKVTLVNGKEVDSTQVYPLGENAKSGVLDSASKEVTVSNLPVLPDAGSWTAPDALTDKQTAAGITAGQDYTVTYKYVVREDKTNSTPAGIYPYAVEAIQADNVYTITNDLTDIDVEKKWSGATVNGDKVTVQLYRSTTPPAGAVAEEKVRITVKVNEWKDESGSTTTAPTDNGGSIMVDIKNGDTVVDTLTLTKSDWQAISRELPKLEDGQGYTVVYKSADGTVVTKAEGFTSTKYNESAEVNIIGVVPSTSAGGDTITFTVLDWGTSPDHAEFKILQFTRAEGTFPNFNANNDDNNNKVFLKDNENGVTRNHSEVIVNKNAPTDNIKREYFRFSLQMQPYQDFYIRVTGGNIYFNNAGTKVLSTQKITNDQWFIIDSSVTKIEFSTKPFDSAANARQTSFLWDDEDDLQTVASVRSVKAAPRKAPTLAGSDAKVSVTGTTNTGTNTFGVNDIAKTGQTPPSSITAVAGTEIVLDGTQDTTGEYAAWKAKWSNLPTVDENGNRIYYYVVETSATKSGATSMSADYKLTNADYIKDASGNIIGIQHVTITNTPGETGKISVSANKVWNLSGGLEADNFAVEFTLYSDVNCTQIVSTANNPQTITGNGKATWTNLNQGTYYVKETKVSYLKNGTTTVLWNGSGTNQYLTNVNDETDTFTNSATSYAVQKRWMTVDGNWNKDYDQTVYFHLKRDGVIVNENGVPEDKVFTLAKNTTATGVADADNIYIKRFGFLPGGTYTVVECTQSGEDLSQEATVNDNTGKSHKLCPEKVALIDGSELDVTAIKNDLYHIKAQKNWAESGVTPAYYPAVTFILKRTMDTVTNSYDWSSVAEYKTETLAAKPASASDAERTVDFGTMPRFDENGREYTYKVFEQPIAGYVSGDSVESVIDGIQTFTITNTPKTINLYVHKEWFEGETNVTDQHTDDVIAYDVYQQAYGSDGNKVGGAEKIALPNGVTGRLPVENKDSDGNITGYGWQETVSDLPMTGTVVTTENDEVNVTPVSYKYYVVETAFGSFTTEYYVENDIVHKSESADDAEHQIGRTDSADQVVSAGTFIRNNVAPVDFSIEKIAKGNTLVKLEGAKFSVQEIDPEDNKLPFKTDSTAKEGTTDEHGLVKFESLTTGIYKVTELQSPDGYIMTGDNFFYIQVTKGKVSVVEKNETTGEWQKREDSAMLRYNPNSSTATVANEPGVALPASGGPGTRLFTILGSILIAGAGVLLVRRRRRLS